MTEDELRAEIRSLRQGLDMAVEQRDELERENDHLRDIIRTLESEIAVLIDQGPRGRR